MKYLKPRDMVYAGLQFDRINEIDLQSQTFDGEAFVWFKWLYDEECKTRLQCLSKPFLITERPEEQQANLLKLGPLALFWEPVQFWNGVYTQSGKIAKIIKKRVILDRWSGEKINYVAFRIKGTFMHEYNLEDYPLDQQDLPVKMSLFCSTDVALIAVDGEPQTSDPMIAPREYCQTKHEGGVRNHYSGTRRMGSSLGDPNWQTRMGTGIDFSVYRASLSVQRHLGSYLFKTFVPLLVLNVVSLVAFWISLRRFDVRMTLTITALLSAIVLYLARTAQLPNVGYATLVDGLFIVSYIAMCSNIAVAIILEWWRREWRNKEKEKKDIITFVNALWPTLVAIVLFALSAIYVGSWDRTEMLKWHLICLGVTALFIGGTWWFCGPPTKLIEDLARVMRVELAKLLTFGQQDDGVMR